MSNKDVLSCPFCGCSASLFEGSIWTKKMYIVKCSHCGASTRKVFPGFNIYNRRTVTDEEAQSKAVGLWNLRSGGEKMGRNYYAEYLESLKKNEHAEQESSRVPNVDEMRVIAVESAKKAIDDYLAKLSN